MSVATRPTIDVEPAEDGALLRIVLNQPKGNVLTGAMMEALAAALAAHRDERRLRLVLLRGAGGNFSFGASVEEHRRDHVAAMLQTFHRVILDLAEYPVPIAALVEGRCLGGAFELALCCHFILAAETARFGCPEIKLGVFPPVFAIAGAHRLNGALAEHLLLTGEELDARSAAAAGLATLLPAGEEAEAAAIEWYRARLAPLSAYALRQAVAAARRGSGFAAALRQQLPALEAHYLDRVVTSRDGNEGIEAFLARRAPTWEDS